VTGIFRANNPLNTFLLFVYGILLKFVWLFHPQGPVVQKSDGFFFKDILTAIKPFFDAHPTGYFIITYLLLFTQAISFNQVIINRRLMQKPNYLPAMSYLLITSFFNEWNVLSAPLIINTILIWVWSKMSSLNNNQHPKSTLFNAGIAIGVAAFFYLPAFAFAIFIILSIIITRPLKIAEWIIAFIGILTPWYFLACWLFFTDKLYSFRLSGFGFSVPSYESYASLSVELIGISLIFLMIIAGAFYVRTFMIKQILQVRKSWALMLLYLVVAIGIPFISMNHNMEYWLLALIPAAAFMGCAFYYPRVKWIPMVLQWISVGFVLYLQYFQK
jgi:hypothetical protein